MNVYELRGTDSPVVVVIFCEANSPKSILAFLNAAFVFVCVFVLFAKFFNTINLILVIINW